MPEPSIQRPVANPWSIAPFVEVSPVTKSEQEGVIVKVAPVSIVTGNDGLGTVQEKEDLWDKLGPIDAMLHSMVSRSTGRHGNKGAKWNSGGVAGWFGWFVGTKGGEDGTQKRL